MAVTDHIEARLRATATGLLFEQATAEVLEALDESGASPILLKGPSFARWLYASPGDRSPGDVDVLVDPEKLARTESWLKEAGFQCTPGLMGDRIPSSRDWTRASDGLVVDVHSYFDGVGASPQEAWATLNARVEWMHLAGTSVKVLDEGARALHLVLHLAKEGATEKSSTDLKLALSNVPLAVWRSAADLAQQLLATTAFVGGLMTHPSGMDLVRRLELTTGPLHPSLSIANAPSAASFFDWASRLSRRDRLALIVRKAFPPASYLREWAPWVSRSPMLLIPGYVVRLFSVARRALQALWWFRANRRAQEPTIPAQRVKR